MSDYYADGEGFLAIRTKINNLAAILKIAETDELISAGAVTSIPIATLTKSLIYTVAISKVQLVNATTGEMHELTLTDDVESGDTALTISSYTFTDDIPVGSAIFVKMEDLLAYIFTTI